MGYFLSLSLLWLSLQRKVYVGALPVQNLLSSFKQKGKNKQTNNSSLLRWGALKPEWSLLFSIQGIFIAVTKFTVRIEPFLYRALWLRIISKSESTTIHLHFFFFPKFIWNVSGSGCWVENIMVFPNTSDAESTAQW